MKSLQVAVLVVVVAAGAGSAAAQEAPPPPGFHTHDGFMIRLMPGFGAGASVTDYGGSDLSISGGGITGSLALGAALNPNLVVTVETAALFATDPTIQVDDMSAEIDDAEYSLQYVGLGASYYLPSNTYFHGGAGALWMTFLFPGEDEPDTTDAGFAFRGLIGKEWWVTDNWGVGLAGQLLLGTVPDGDADWSVAILSLHLSATYN